MILLTLQRFPQAYAALERHISMVTALLREGDGAGVEIEVPVAERRPRRDMRVPMQQNIPRLQRRELLQV